MNGRTVAIVLMVALGLAWLAQTRQNHRRWRGHVLASAVERTSVGAASAGRINARLLERNLKRLDEAAALDATNVHIPLLRGGQYLLMQRTEPALQAYEAALALEPRAEIYLNMGRAHRMAGDHELAEAAFRKALALDHNLMKSLASYLESRDRLKRPRAQREKETSEIMKSGFEDGRMRDWTWFRGWRRQ